MSYGVSNNNADMYPDIGRILIEQRGDNCQQSDDDANRGDDSIADTKHKKIHKLGDLQGSSGLNTEMTAGQSSVLGDRSPVEYASLCEAHELSSRDAITQETLQTAQSDDSHFRLPGSIHTIEDLESVLASSAVLDIPSPDEFELPVLDDFPDDVDLVYSVVENNLQHIPAQYSLDPSLIRHHELVSQQVRHDSYIPQLYTNPRRR